MHRVSLHPPHIPLHFILLLPDQALDYLCVHFVRDFMAFSISAARSGMTCLKNLSLPVNDLLIDAGGLATTTLVLKD